MARPRRAGPGGLSARSSDVYEIYCRLSHESALGVTAAIASAAVTPAADAFHEEHLELLQEEVGEFRRAFGEFEVDEEEERL